jgi:HD domain
MKLPTEVAGIPLIDSKIAQEATDLVRATSTPSLFNHSMRTYLFGALLGKDLSFDYELFYLASVLHDLGLTEKYAGDRSFEIEGAEAARKSCAAIRAAPIAVSCEILGSGTSPDFRFPISAMRSRRHHLQNDVVLPEPN